ncbi:carboxypeptidase regulatory-like domain-containing protein [Myroides sp. LJL119]
MKTLSNKLIYILLGFVLCISSCSEDYLDDNAQGTIEGIVVSEIDLKPLANIKIETSPLTTTVFTDEKGKFVLDNIKQGEYSVKAQGKGYSTNFQPAAVYGDKKSNVIFEMQIETQSSVAPKAPELFNPKNNQQLQSTSTTFTWSSEKTNTAKMSYTLTLRNANNDKVLNFQEITDTVFTYDKLELAGKYFWQVSVHTDKHEPVKSEMGVFSVYTTPLTNRILFARKVNENYVIYSTDSQSEEFALTDAKTSSFRARRNVEADKIAFFQNNAAQTDIYIMDRDGANPKKVTTSIKPAGFNMNEIGFCWPSASEYIYFANFNKLYRIKTNGQGLELIYQSSPEELISEIDVNHNENIIVLKTNNINGYQAQIYAVDFQGNKLFSVLDNVKGAVSGIHLSSKADKILYSHDTSLSENSQYRRYANQVFLYDRVTNKTTLISEKMPSGSIDIDPRFSPNEAQVILTNTSNDARSQSDLYSVDIESKARTLLQENAMMADWN